MSNSSRRLSRGDRRRNDRIARLRAVVTRETAVLATQGIVPVQMVVDRDGTRNPERFALRGPVQRVRGSSPLSSTERITGKVDFPSGGRPSSSSRPGIGAARAITSR